MGGGPAPGIAITLHRIQRYIRLIARRWCAGNALFPPRVTG
jgi:hypothetical protein